MLEGVVLKVNLSGGFAFIGCPGQPDLFAHRTEFRDLEWTEQLRGHRVTCEMRNAPKGPEAFNVRPAWVK